ncbi:hypothetical protein B0H14DRAFT_628373 [Mycena olivaceomarginata]|nr:hypothetical protein B0H14DRAFT_628373 [Mycena olivaceomarginata]
MSPCLILSYGYESVLDIICFFPVLRELYSSQNVEPASQRRHADAVTSTSRLCVGRYSSAAVLIAISASTWHGWVRGSFFYPHSFICPYTVCDAVPLNPPDDDFDPDQFIRLIKRLAAPNLEWLTLNLEVSTGRCWIASCPWTVFRVVTHGGRPDKEFARRVPPFLGTSGIMQFDQMLCCRVLSHLRNCGRMYVFGEDSRRQEIATSCPSSTYANNLMMAH